jgi:hypothetical protein
VTALTRFIRKQRERVLKARMILSCIFIGLEIIAVVFITAQVSADKDEVPFELQVKLILTALTYDRNLTQKADGTLTVGILFFPDTAHSQKQAINFSKALEGFKDKKVSSLNINQVVIEYKNSKDLEYIFDQHDINVLYIATGRGERLKEILELTRSKKVLSCTPDNINVYEYEVSLGWGIVDNKTKLCLNITSAKAEGADFSAKFLRVVDVIDFYKE